jgi:hypothetical protein
VSCPARRTSAFFDQLDILDGEVISVVPRAEYAAQVVALLEHVGAVARSSPGGIRHDTYETLFGHLRYA